MKDSHVLFLGVVSSVIAGYIVYVTLKDKGDGKSGDSKSVSDIRKERSHLMGMLRPDTTNIKPSNPLSIPF